MSDLRERQIRWVNNPEENDSGLELHPNLL